MKLYGAISLFILAGLCGVVAYSYSRDFGFAALITNILIFVTFALTHLIDGLNNKK